MLPSCWSSLSVKLPQEFKKLMERLKKLTEVLQPDTRLACLWKVLQELYLNGNIKDFSRTTVLKEELKTPQQFNPQLKLSFKERISTLSMPFNETFLQLEDEDEQYR